jgi:hypothetical protein
MPLPHHEQMTMLVVALSLLAAAAVAESGGKIFGVGLGKTGSTGYAC